MTQKDTFVETLFLDFLGFTSVLLFKYVRYHGNKIQLKMTSSHCLKITDNVEFDLFNFGIFHHFLSY